MKDEKYAFDAHDLEFGGCRMLHRMVCLLCCAVLALAPLGALTEEAVLVMAGYDGEESTHEWENNQFFTRMQARTGLTFAYRQYNKRTEWQTAKDAMFQTGDLPDVLFKAALTTEELIRYTESGQLIDLLPLLPEHAPNLWKLLEANPDWLRAITLPNGKVGALPAIQTTGVQNAMWINQQWLERLELDMPVNLDSLHDVLVAFRDRDPNGNGRQDEIPLAFLGPWELKFLSHAWGVAVNDYNIYLDEAGQVHYWPMEDSFIELARTMRDWLAEGLLDSNGFHTADSLRRIADEDATITYGVMFAPMPATLLPYQASRQYVLLEPLVYEGKQLYRDLTGAITRGAFAITSACADPAALLRWVDVLYTEEGAVEAMIGFEGENYEMDEDGYWDWVGGTKNVSMTALNALTIYDTGDMPWLFPETFYSRYQDAGVRKVDEEMTRLMQWAVQPFPLSYTLTMEESRQVSDIQQELGTYVDISLARFVLGEVEITEETIEAFHRGLLERDAQQMADFWQEMADRP